MRAGAASLVARAGAEHPKERQRAEPAEERNRELSVAAAEYCAYAGAPSKNRRERERVKYRGCAVGKRAREREIPRRRGVTG